MAHINSIGASMFSDLAVATPATDLSASALAALQTAAAFQALFATEIPNVGGTKAANAFTRITNVREFPSVGIPPNLSNVPVFGSATSQQVQGQSDAPAFELTLNHVPADWSKDAGVILGNMVGNGIQYVFRFTLMNSQPTGTTATKFASTAAGLGTVQNSQYYFIGKIESNLVNPQLTDATTSTVSISMQSQIYGAYTV